MTTTTPAPEALPLSADLPPVSRVQGRAAATRSAAARNTARTLLEDQCPECGWRGDAEVHFDPDEGLFGWDCPGCSYFVVTRDLIPDEREDLFS